MSLKNKRILIISSVSPCSGPGTLALDCYNALKQSGIAVDLLTKLPVDGFPEFIHVQEKRSSKFNNLFFKLWSKHVNLPSGYGLFYRNESTPPVKINKILKKIKKEYDVVITLFWQELLSFSSMDAIYEYLNHPKLVFICVDYSTITGGCHFFGDCRRFFNGCGKCPMIHSSSENDFTHRNVLFRQKFNRKTNPIYLANTYMLEFCKNAAVFNQGETLEFCSMILDLENKFVPLDKLECKKKLGFGDDDFVIFFGSQNIKDKRKGFDYLRRALDVFNSKLNLDQRKHVKLLIAGKSIEAIKDNLPFEYLYLGYVNNELLPTLYSASDTFISPSINDAGPSMVNQSIACGTPVISFDMGSAIDVIENHITGFRVPIGDYNAMGGALFDLYQTDNVSKNEISIQCRKKAIEMNSFSAFIKTLERIL